ncbi:transposase [candidate division CSSED10-310 bacterium]|uniref:Transposase n=1 Tax=candidate division CSSED10-310 bacterium TaxID=2855610 RepID=A0ABV6Z1Z4_UNCC1
MNNLPLNIAVPGNAGIPAGQPSHKGWYSRGYLPHLDQPGLIQTLVFRLFDAVPEHVVEQWRIELNWCEGLAAADPREVQLRNRIARYEDAGHGSCWLRRQQIADMVENTLLFFDGNRYRVLAWCIMPNHVHVLIETHEGWPLFSIAHSWKSFSATEANKILRRAGTFWFRESYDRYIRNQKHLQAAQEYIDNNPVAAGLVNAKEKWPWSSAGGKRVEEMPARMPAVPDGHQDNDD